jgi:type I restriction enzyme S subunit
MRMGSVDLSDIRYVPEDVAPAIARYRVEAGDIFISCAGTLGIVGTVPDELDGANLTENANRISSIEINPDFLLRVLCSDLIQDHITNIQTVGAQPKLALGRIRSFEIPCPDDPAEQQAIAEALSDADGVVEGLERLIEKKRRIKQGAMQDLLTAKRRLPGFSGEWVERKVGSIAKITTGSKDTQDRETNGVYPFFVRSQTVERINSVGFDGVGVLTAGDGVGTGKIFHYIDGKCDFHQRVYLLHAFDPELSARYFFHYFSNFFFDRIMSMTAKSSVDSVRREMISEMNIRLPTSLKEQEGIAKTLDDMDAEVAALETRLQKARAIKEGMMQNLLTGRIRLV